MASKTNHLVIIIDCSPPYILLHSNKPELHGAWLNSIITFANSHLLMDRSNQLTVIGSNCQSNEIIYPPALESIPPSANGQYELLSKVTGTLAEGIRRMASNTNLPAPVSHTDDGPPDPLISGALAIALACIKKRKEKSKLVELAQDNTARIAVLSPNPDTVASFASQYMSLMNVFFTAQKMGVVIDVCVIGNTTGVYGSTLLQQGADLSDGLYLRVQNISSLVEYLNWTLLPDISTRHKLVLPSQKKVSLRAACFCHRQLIEMSYVCSVCLSIFCSYSPICTTCNSHFKLSSLTGAERKKTSQESTPMASGPSTPS